MHQSYISGSSFHKSLIIKQHIVHFSCTSICICKCINSCLRIMIMSGKNHADIFIFRDNFIVDSLWFLAKSTACQQIFMEIQYRFSFRILCQHIVHPLYFFISDTPAHVKHNKVNSVYRNQIIMTTVIFVTSTVPWI